MRNHMLDAAKAVAAYFVVLLHIRFPGRIGEMINVLARFAVPFFFMISGYFCFSGQKKCGWRKLKGKIRHILFLCLFSYPFYLFWQCIHKTIQGENWREWIAGVFTVEHLEEFLRYNNSSPVKWHLWFLPALLYCYLLFALLDHFEMYRLGYVLIPFLLLCHFWMEEAEVFTGSFYRTMEFRNYLYTGLPFFMLGHWFHKQEELWSRQGFFDSVWIPVMVGAGAVCSILEYFYFGILELFTGTILTAAGVFLFCLKNKNGHGPKLLADIGSKYAFSIYLLHLAVGDFWKDLAVWVGVEEGAIYLWSRPAAVCVLTTVLAWVLRKAFLHGKAFFCRYLFNFRKMWYDNKC